MTTSCSSALGIVPGPDGALWFIEQDGHAIGRVTAEGELTEHRLRSSVYPYSSTDPSKTFPQ